MLPAAASDASEKQGHQNVEAVVRGCHAQVRLSVSPGRERHAQEYLSVAPNKGVTNVPQFVGAPSGAGGDQRNRE